MRQGMHSGVHFLPILTATKPVLCASISSPSSLIECGQDASQQHRVVLDGVHQLDHKERVWAAQWFSGHVGAGMAWMTWCWTKSIPWQGSNGGDGGDGEENDVC